VKSSDQAVGEDASQNNHGISTNSLYLSRYAKDLNMNSYQRIEITEPKLGSDEATNVYALQEDDTLSTDYKNDVTFHDYLEEMKTICDKLEEATGKVICSRSHVTFYFSFTNFVQQFSLYIGSPHVISKKGSQLQDGMWAQSVEKCRFGIIWCIWIFSGSVHVECY
jgi:hypothetical protein